MNCRPSNAGSWSAISVMRGSVSHPDPAAGICIQVQMQSPEALRDAAGAAKGEAGWQLPTEAMAVFRTERPRLSTMCRWPRTTKSSWNCLSQRPLIRRPSSGWGLYAFRQGGAQDVYQTMRWLRKALHTGTRTSPIHLGQDDPQVPSLGRGYC